MTIIFPSCWDGKNLDSPDHESHVEKLPFSVPFVCGCRNLGEALRRVAEGAAMIRTKGEAGTGDVVEAATTMQGWPAEEFVGDRMSTLKVGEVWKKA